MDALTNRDMWMQTQARRYGCTDKNMDIQIYKEEYRDAEPAVS